jgi:hypothetical protein
MTTVLRRPDLSSKSENLSGLLIINHDLATHPMKRPRLYAGDEEEIVAAAREYRIGLLSTVELYKIAIAVKDGRLSPEEGRRIIETFGRIEFARQE